jgi:hypothetical protein
MHVRVRCGCSSVEVHVHAFCVCMGWVMREYVPGAIRQEVVLLQLYSPPSWERAGPGLWI